MSTNPNLGDALSSGKTVGGGRYILNRKIGDHSNTWLAQDDIDNKPVVLTFLPPELYQDPRALEDLRNQISTVRDLSHPNLGNIYELYEADGDEPFISAEYIEGMNLTALQQMQPGKVFSWSFLLPLLKQIFAALQYVHENNLVQGSLKPSNLMLDRKGQIKLLDAGVAGILNNPLFAGPPKAGAGGLLPYLSPQQIDGNPPSPTDDVYSLGITVYEFLTSTVPFNSGDILPQIRNSQPQTIEQRLAQLRITNPVPPIVSSMIMSCLAKDPGSRPQTVETLAKSLEFAEMAPPEPAKPVAPARPEPRPVQAAVPIPPSPAPVQAAPAMQAPAAKKKSPAVAIAIAAVAVLAIGGGAAFFLMKKPADTTNPAANSPNPTVANNNPPANNTSQETPEEKIAREARELAERKASGKTTTGPITTSKAPSGTIENPLSEQEEKLARRRVQEAIELGELAKRNRSGGTRTTTTSPTTSATKPSTTTATKPATLSTSNEGFTSIFNGQDLNGWKGDPTYWSVTDGSITAQTPSGAPANITTCLIWQGGSVGDFELRFQYKFQMVRANPSANAGVVYRGKRRGDWDVWGYECRLTMGGEQLGMLQRRDDRRSVMSFTQRIIVRPGSDGTTDKLEPAGDLLTMNDVVAINRKEEWNECVIKVEGNRFIHAINGRVVADLTDNNDSKRDNSGYLALALSTGSKPAAFVQFKDVQIKRLSR